MAITIVGTAQAGAAINGGDITLTFDGTPAENDVVVLVGGNADSNGNNVVGPVTLGYTEAALYKVNDGTNISSGVWYKVLGSTPDGSVVGNGGGVSQEAAAYASVVLRGVDTTTPLDATIVETGPSSGAAPDLAAIVTVTDGAWVIAAANLTDDNAPTVAPTGYSNLAGAAANDTRPLSVGIATKEVASAGSEDPDAFTWDTDAWYGFTIAIRPAGDGGITGTLAETEAADTLSASGTFTPPAITGTLAETEAADTLSASGTFTPAAITGTLAETEADDTLSASGTFTPAAITGTLTETEADDTLSASGTFTPAGVTGTLAETEEADTLAASGTFTPSGITGTLAETEDADTLSASGTFTPPAVTGTLAETEAADTLSASGTFTPSGISGSLAETEEADTLSASGSFTAPTVTGTIAETEADDTLSASGTFTPAAVTGTLAETEADDTLAAVGSVANTTGMFQEGGLTVVVQAGVASSSSAGGGLTVSRNTGGLSAGGQE